MFSTTIEHLENFSNSTTQSWGRLEGSWRRGRNPYCCDCRSRTRFGMLLSGYIPSLYADAIFAQDVFGGADTKYLADKGWWVFFDPKVDLRLKRCISWYLRTDRIEWIPSRLWLSSQYQHYCVWWPRPQLPCYLEPPIRLRRKFSYPSDASQVA